MHCKKKKRKDVRAQPVKTDESTNIVLFNARQASLIINVIHIDTLA